MKLKLIYLTANVMIFPNAVFASPHDNLNITSNVTIIGPDSIVNSTVGATGALTLVGDAWASNITVEDGGIFAINKDVQADATHVHKGGTQSVDGTATNSVIDGKQFVSGRVIGTNVTGAQSVFALGSAEDTELTDGGQQYLAGTATSTTVNNNSRQQVQNGGVANDTTVNEGGWQQIQNGGVANDTTVNEGGWQQVLDGGRAKETVINNGGAQNVDAGAVISDTIVMTGGRQHVAGTADKTNVNGGVQGVSGSVTNSLLSNGGQQYLGGTATGTTVNNNSRQQVQNGGVANDTTVNEGGWQQVLDGGRAKETVINNGGAQNVDAGAVVSDTTVMTGGSQHVAGTADKTNVNGGEQGVTGSVTNTLLSNGGQQYLGGTATGTTVNKYSRQQVQKGGVANDTTVNDDGWQQVMSGGIVNNTTVNAGLLTLTYGTSAYGDTIVNTNGRMFMHPDSRAANVSLKNGTLTVVVPEEIDSDAKNESAVVDKLTVDGGSVVLQAGSAGRFANIHIGEINGSGNFLFNTSLDDRKSNFVTIGTGTGSFDIIVNDSGKEITDHTDLTVNLIHDQGGGTNFSMITAKGRSEGTVDGGTYMYTLKKGQNKDGLVGGNVWYLGAVTDKPDADEKPGENNTSDENNTPGENDTPDENNISGGNDKPGKPKTTPATDAILSMATAGLNIIHAELDGMRAYRANQGKTGPESNIWGHYLGAKNHTDNSNGAAYQLNQNGMEIGADTRTDLERGSLITGAFMSWSDNKVKHARGGKSKIDSYGFGVYATWSDNSGFYADSVLKANFLNNKLSAVMTNGGKTIGDWKQYGFSSSVEGGYQFDFKEDVSLTPYARLTIVQMSSEDVVLSNGMKGNTNTPRSFTGEVGAKLTGKFSLGSAEFRPYLSAAVVQEFAGSNEVTINERNRFDNNVKGTSGKYGLGASVNAGRDVTLYGEANYCQGSRTETPVQGVIGISVGF